MAVVAGLLVSTAAQAQDANVFRPSGPWALDYGDDYCRLGRVFTDGSNEVEVGIERIRPGEQVRIWLVGDAVRTFRGATETGYTFLPSQSERTVQPIRSSRAGLQVMSLPEVTLKPFAPPAPGARFTPPPPYDPAAEQAFAKGITAIGLGKGLTRPLRFETGALDAPIAALQACTDDLVKSWGVDPDKNKSLSVPAIPQGQPWLAANTIGFADFAKMAGNANQVRVMINAEGKPTSCHIAWATLGDEVNGGICKSVMEKASFIPAKDSGGQAVASYWMGSPMFLMPPMGGGRR
ncbi:MAG: hypothetical protein B7Z08_03875 [Sphingomonadales bacterium 32-68-7]|nr:MAG: hypothetical protein B7Z33_02315 [Sphingomonadales bacterium 12-68-11]OYX09791.1 MAG: hypothetical protein B7Z08_03875 [Sphingomonadales bacterium 32-68-7]